MTHKKNKILIKIGKKNKLKIYKQCNQKKIIIFVIFIFLLFIILLFNLYICIYIYSK